MLYESEDLSALIVVLFILFWTAPDAFGSFCIFTLACGPPMLENAPKPPPMSRNRRRVSAIEYDLWRPIPPDPDLEDGSPIKNYYSIL